MNGDKRALRHNLLTGRTQTVACYPRPEYWRIELRIDGHRNGWPVTEQITLAPDCRVRASQMHTILVDQWRASAADFDEVSDAAFDLYRVSPQRYRDLVDQELARVLCSEVAV